MVIYVGVLPFICSPFFHELDAYIFSPACFPGHGSSTQVGTEASSQCAQTHYAGNTRGEDYEPPTLQDLSGKHCYKCRECQPQHHEYYPASRPLHSFWKCRKSENFLYKCGCACGCRPLRFPLSFLSHLCSCMCLGQGLVYSYVFCREV